MKVFVTGGHGGIGSAVCEKFAREGYEVTAPGSKELDLSDLATVKNYFAARDGRFDAVVHCAGYNPPLSVEDTTIEEFDRTQNINLTSLLEITRVVAPYIKEQKRGRIVGIASLYATISRENRVSYACSKHGLVGLIKTLALELGQFGVLCNTVSPGYVDTAMFRSRNDTEKRAFLASKVPLKRLAEPADIAEVVYFLCSENNRYLNGQDIIVDGGFMAGSFQ